MLTDQFANMALSTQITSTTAPPTTDRANQIEAPNQHAKTLPPELWTQVLSHVPYVDIWLNCRLVSHAFQVHGDYILWTQYLKEEVCLLHGINFFKFSHVIRLGFNDVQIAYFKPSTMPGDMWLSHWIDLLVDQAAIWRPDNPLVLMQLCTAGSKRESAAEAQGWEGVETVEGEGGCVGIFWRRFCAKYLVKWNANTDEVAVLEHMG